MAVPKKTVLTLPQIKTKSLKYAKTVGREGSYSRYLTKEVLREFIDYLQIQAIKTTIQNYVAPSKSKK